MIPDSSPGIRMHLLGTRLVRCGDRLDRDVARQQGLRLHEVRARTHRQQVKHEDTFDQNNLLTRGQEIAVDVDESKAVFVELKPGQASLHHVLLFHGSEPNRSDDRRIGLAVRYIPTRLKQAVGQRTGRLWCAARTIIITSRPEYVAETRLEPEALAFHKAVTEEQVRVLYRGDRQDSLTARNRDAISKFHFARVAALDRLAPAGCCEAVKGARTSGASTRADI